jgi:GntR family transcriptional regulator / MocR family aminotransferase
VSAWRLLLEVGDRGPLFQRVARAVIGDIRRGRLQPGDALPGTRILAEDLSMHRNTVKAAYAELLAQGWIETRPSAGTFVSTTLPERRRSPTPRMSTVASATRVGFSLPPTDLPPADTWEHLAGADIVFAGLDVELLPRKALARAYRHALASSPDILGYRLGRGHARIVAALQTMLAAARGIPRDRPLLVTRGSQMALFLAAIALFRRGDAIAVEQPGYAFSWPALRMAGLELVPIPVDERGLRVDRLATALAQREISGVLVTPHAQYPTGVTLRAERRLELLALAARHRFMILEDDFVHEVRLDGPPILPLASGDTTGNVIYLGSFSKTFAPALRLGFVVGPEPVIERLARARARVDVCGDSATEVAVADLLEDGEIQRHVRRITRAYRMRRDVLIEEVHRRLGTAVRFDASPAGSSLWLDVDPSIDVERWANAGLVRGVGFLTGRHFFLDEAAECARPHIWLGFGGLEESRIVAGVARMARALTDIR